MGHESNDASHVPFDDSTADRLLHLLSTDDAFRALFTKDRHAALAQAGFPATADASLDCCQVNTLASKEEIAASREQLQSQLTSQGIMTVIFCFEANQVGSAPTDR